MIQFNDLRISEDKKYLIIDVQIKNLDWYNNNYLESIIIDTQKDYKVDSWHQKKENDPFYIEFQQDSIKHYIGNIPIEGLSDNMFFVHVTANKKWAPDTPCGLRDNYAMGVAYDKQLLYTQGMGILNTIDSCYISSDVLDYILRCKAFEANLKAGYYNKAIDYWKLLTGIKTNTITHNCGCHGII